MVVTTPWEQGRNSHDSKRVGSGLLIQTADNHEISLIRLKNRQQKTTNATQMADLLFAWNVAKYVKSNAIVFCGNGMTLGVGAGQMSRVDSTKIAAIKAQNAGLSLQNSVVASDAFFPFRDGIDVLAEAGAMLRHSPWWQHARRRSDCRGRRTWLGDDYDWHSPL